MRAVLAGYFGFDNVGDELLAQAALRALRERHPFAEVTLLSGAPSASAERFGVRAVSMWNPLSVASALLRADRLLLGGGGLIQDHTSRRSLAYYLSLVAFALACGKTVGLCNLGVDPLRSRALSRAFSRLASNRRVQGAFRDEASRDAARNAGLERIYPLSADGVFSLSEGGAFPEGRAHELLLIVREPPVPSIVLDTLFALSRERGLRAAGAAFQPGGDVAFAGELCGRFDAAPLGGLSPASARSSVARVARVASARYHALVLAAVSGRPFLGIGDPGKNKSLCREFDMPFLDWESGEGAVRLAFQKLLAKAPPAPALVENLRRRAEMGYHAAMGVFG